MFNLCDCLACLILVGIVLVFDDISWYAINVVKQETCFVLFVKSAR